MVLRPGDNRVSPLSEDLYLSAGLPTTKSVNRLEMVVTWT